MTTFLSRNEKVGYIQKGNRRITLYEIESVDGVPFVSGIQGLICTTFTGVDERQPPGENNPKPVCMSVDLVTTKHGIFEREAIPAS